MLDTVTALTRPSFGIAELTAAERTDERPASRLFADAEAQDDGLVADDDLNAEDFDGDFADLPYLDVNAAGLTL